MNIIYKALKIDVFHYPIIVLASNPGYPANIHIKLILRETIVIELLYIFAADSRDLSSFKFLWWALKDARFMQCNY